MERVPEYDPQAPKGLALSALTWAARQKPVTWFLVNVGNKIDPYLMRASGGRLKTTINAPTVLLTHTGAKSGKKRTTPLAYFTDGDKVILIASRGGHREHPAWYHNVDRQSRGRALDQGRRRPLPGRGGEGNERERLWALATEFYPGFARYQERAGDRRIPVVVCTPQDD